MDTQSAGSMQADNRQRELELSLGSNGKAALKSMVEYNLLAVRTRSSLAHDLPPEVYLKGTAVAGGGFLRRLIALTHRREGK